MRAASLSSRSTPACPPAGAVAGDNVDIGLTEVDAALLTVGCIVCESARPSESEHCLPAGDTEQAVERPGGHRSKSPFGRVAAQLAAWDAPA